MTSVFSVNNGAALLILRQTNVSADVGADQTSATDKITAIVNGVSSEDTTGKTQASSSINRALLDMREADDSIVSDALAFLDSDSFQTSDPSVRDTLKQLISEKGAEFAVLVKAEKAKNPGMTNDNAMANVMRSLIQGNREKFGDDEIVIGFKLANGASIIANIADVNGKSTSNSLEEKRSASLAAHGDAVEDFLNTDKNAPGALKSAGDAMTAGISAVLDAVDAQSQWLMKWKDAFGF